MSSLARQYLETTATSYPGFALAWGRFESDPEPMAPAHLERIYAGITGALPAEPGVDHESATLRWCVEDRLVDLHRAMTARNDPQFWVDRHCYGILAQLAGSTLLRDCPIPRRWIAAFIRNIEPVLANAREHLDLEAMGNLDARRARQHLDASMKLLAPVSRFSDPTDRDLDKARSAIHRLSAWIGNHTGRRSVRLPIGPADWDAGVRARTGLALPVDDFEAELGDLIAAAPNPASPAATPEPIPTAHGDIAALMRKVADVFRHEHGPATCLADLRLEVGTERVPGVSSAAYQRATSRGGGDAVVFVRPDAYTTAVDLQLDLAHECMPGHHWQASAYRRRHRHHPLCMAHPNSAFVEGWGRWCEQRYADLVAEPAVTRRFRIRAARFAGRALAALLIHARGMSLPTVTGRLVAARIGTPTEAAALALTAYFDPWRAVEPAAGYLAIRRAASQSSVEALTAQVAAGDAVELARPLEVS